MSFFYEFAGFGRSFVSFKMYILSGLLISKCLSSMVEAFGQFLEKKIIFCSKSVLLEFINEEPFDAQQFRFNSINEFEF